MRGPRNDNTGTVCPQLSLRGARILGNAAISISQRLFSPPSLRGRALFALTKQSPYPRCMGERKSEIATGHRTSLAMTKPLGKPKARLPRLLTQARNDGTEELSIPKSLEGSCSLLSHCEEPVFCATRQSLYPKLFSPPSLRGGTVFVPTWQSLVSKIYWRNQKRDCFGPLAWPSQ